MQNLQGSQAQRPVFVFVFVYFYSSSALNLCLKSIQKIVQFHFQKYKIFPASEGAHPPLDTECASPQ